MQFLSVEQENANIIQENRFLYKMVTYANGCIFFFIYLAHGFKETRDGIFLQSKNFYINRIDVIIAKQCLMPELMQRERILFF